MMTNEDKIKKMTTEELARLLIHYEDDKGCSVTTDWQYFGKEEDAIKHEIEWLKKEC